VGATATTWLSNSWGFFKPFDVAIVDEAAQMTLPATLGALRLARRFILIGDHKQLPSVVVSEPRKEITPVENAAPRLSESLFEQLYHCYQVNHSEAIVDLNEQYRMNAEICALPRDMWYEKDLKPANEDVSNARLALLSPVPTAHRLVHALDPESPVVFLDVPWSQEWTGPRTNQREAQVVAELLEAYLKAGLRLDSAGIIAPFRSQVALIRRTVEASISELAGKSRSVVDTVDRFQGQERDLIIISLAVHAAHVHDLLKDERRLNVAISRARHKLIILGDQAVLRQERTYSALIDRCKLVYAL
jgi:DNA replication ATP-dependent helicase Dna2